MNRDWWIAFVIFAWMWICLISLFVEAQVLHSL